MVSSYTHNLDKANNKASKRIKYNLVVTVRSIKGQTSHTMYRMFDLIDHWVICIEPLDNILLIQSTTSVRYFVRSWECLATIVRLNLNFAWKKLMLSFILLLVRRQFKKIQIQTMVNMSSCPEPQMLFFICSSSNPPSEHKGFF